MLARFSCAVVSASAVSTSADAAAAENRKSGLTSARNHLERIFKDVPLGRRHKAEALGTHHGVGIDHTTAAKPRTGMKHSVRMQLTAITHHNVVVNHDAWVKNAIGADAAPRWQTCARARAA